MTRRRLWIYQSLVWGIAALGLAAFASMMWCEIAACGIKRKIQLICEIVESGVAAPDLVFKVTIFGLSVLSASLAYMLVLGL